MNGGLLEAAMTGNVPLLHALLREDESILDRAMHECNARILDQAMDECNARILDRAMQKCNAGILDQARDECIARILDRAMHKCIAKDNPVHLATLFGHANFVREILSLKPEFAWALNSQGLSPLHLASEIGHVEVVKELLWINVDLCLVCDPGGRIPLHLAGIRGQVEVLEKLVKAMPITAWLLTDEREPILHLCANHNQFKALEKLVELVKDDNFLKLTDTNKNNILHLLSAKTNATKLIESLLRNHEDAVDVNAINADGSTPLDVSLENVNGFENLKTNWILISAGAQARLGKRRELPHKKIKKKPNENDSSWSSEALLVVAILLTTVAFQAGLNPPGGVWQDTGYHNDTSFSPPKPVQHIAGESILSYLNPKLYFAFTFLNIFTLFASTSAIVLLLSKIFFNLLLFWSYSVILTLVSGYTMLLSYAISSTMVFKEGHSAKNYPKILECVALASVLFVEMIMLPVLNTKWSFLLYIKSRQFVHHKLYG